MFVMLSRVLLWLLIGTIVYSLFQRFYPSGGFFGRFILVVLAVVLVLSFFNPGGTGTVVSPLWQVVSFPLKPLGAAILMMIFAAQRLKGGAIDKPGGYLLGWALTILLISSTPAFAYFLVSPRLASLLPEGERQTLVAQVYNSDVSNIVSGSLRSDVPSYLMQTRPSDTARRGRIAIEDFVPNAQALAEVTSAWEAYLNNTFRFLRGA
jgi:hypothetical protein